MARSAPRPSVPPLLAVVFLPRDADGLLEGRVAVVVDVIRATTTITTLVEARATRIVAARSHGHARALRAAYPGALLFGETGGVRPEGFDYGNSPIEAAAAPVAGRTVVMATTNGTDALRAAGAAAAALVGCLRNAAACARAALDAGGERGIVVVCAGREGHFAIDDAYTAGAIARHLLDRGRFEPTDSALAALRLADGDALEVFRRSRAGASLVPVGLGDDVVYCAQADRSTAVPALGREVLVVEEA